MTNILTLPFFQDEALLISTQNSSNIPFSIKRVFIISRVFAGTVRGKHAHKKTQQAIFCIQGTVSISMHNGKRKRVYTLTAPHKGVFIDRMVWSEMYNFSPDAVIVVFASEAFSEKDYIRDYQLFLRCTHKKYDTHE